MAHDKNGKPIHVGDQVVFPGRNAFHVNGVMLDDGTVIGGNVAKAKQVAMANQLELVEKDPQNENKPSYGKGCIVWGNGKVDGPPPV